MYILNNL